MSNQIAFVAIQLVNLLSILILIRVILSWIDPLGNISVTRFVQSIVDPILTPIRNLLPNLGGFDFSPLVAMLLLQLLLNLLSNTLA